MPEALQPEEIRNGEKGEPFAVKTRFGWTLNRPLRGTEEVAANCFVTATNQTCDLLSKQLQEYFNHEFDDCISENRRMMSANDKRALKIFEESARLLDGHYTIAVPWKKSSNMSLQQSLCGRKATRIFA